MEREKERGDQIVLKQEKGTKRETRSEAKKGDQNEPVEG